MFVKALMYCPKIRAVVENMMLSEKNLIVMGEKAVNIQPKSMQATPSAIQLLLPHSSH
jgi:hypothetical protein